MPSGSQALSRPGVKPHYSGPVSQGPHKPAGNGPPTESAPEKPTGASSRWRCNANTIIPA